MSKDSKMATMSASQIDAIYKNLGSPGQFTLRQLVCLAIGAFPCVYQLLSNVFIGQGVHHRCAPPSNLSVLLSHYPSDVSLNVTYEKCEILININDSVTDKLECVYGMEYDQPRDSSIISEFDLVCSRSPLFHLTQTLVIGGQGLGAIVATIMADKFGRRILTVGANFSLLLTGLGIAFSPNYIVFAIFKLLAGASQQAYLNGSMTLFMEMLTAKNRRWSTTIEGVKWISGVTTLPFVAYLLRQQSWRVLQITLSLTALPAFFQLWYIQESLRWLTANGESDKAKKYIEYAARINGKKYDDIIQAALQVSESTTDSENIEIYQKRENGCNEQLTRLEPETECTSPRQLTVIDLLRIKILLINSLVMWCAWFTAVLGFFALYLISRPVVGDFHLNFFLNAVTEIPALIFLYFTQNRMGRKWTTIALFSILSFGLIVTGVTRSVNASSSTAAFALVGSLIAVFGASGAVRIVFSYTMELFPTNIRNQALGISSLLGRAGGMIAPFMTVIAEQAKWAPGILIGCLSFIVVLLLKLPPETNKRELPQTLEELHKMEKGDKSTKA